jgi:hypothetical protein
VKARTFIITTCAALVLVVPAAHAASTSNRLYQARTHTALFEKSHQALAKGCTGKSSTKFTATKSKGEAGQVAVPVSAPAAPGTATPIPADTNDDYDNPQVLDGAPASQDAPAVDSSSSDESSTATS